MVPIVQESISPGVRFQRNVRDPVLTWLKQAISHLDEDGLNLWLSALRNTVTISSVNGAPALAELFPRALELLATNLDLLGKITTIIESYIVLDATAILQVNNYVMMLSVHLKLL